jgi:hypothetical protein
VTAYDAREFSRAIDFFKRAYELSKAPQILFDIGQSYRSLGDCHKAFDAFGAFIAVAAPDDPLVVKARARQIDLRTCAIETITSSKQDGGGAPSDVRPVPAVDGPHEPSLTLSHDPVQPPAKGARFAGTGKGMVCTAATGGALTLAGLGLVLGGAAWSLQGTVENSTVWNADSQRADDRGRAFGQASTLAFVGAGVTAVAAAVVCWLGWRESRPGAQ